MEADWDLHAVVSGCAASSTAAASAASPSCSFNPRLQQDEDLDCSHDLFDLSSSTNNSTAWFNEELHDLYLPFLHRPAPPSEPPPPPQNPPPAIPVIPGLQASQLNITSTRIQATCSQSLCSNASSITTASNSRAQNQTGKRRKNQMKRLCQVPAEDLGSDMWSWRKYGQKPIKGSPYPRGYYRCSTSKGCLARKQVERNRSDPSMFIVTYTAEHNHPMPTHRNSLAGSTRHKAAAAHQTTTSGTGSETNKPTSSPPEKQESSPDGDDEFGVADVAMNGNAPEDDDFFEGMAELGESLKSDDAEDSFSDNFQDAMQFEYWLPDNATTTAGGGG